MKTVKLFSAFGITYFVRLVRDNARTNSYYEISIAWNPDEPAMVTPMMTSSMMAVYENVKRQNMLTGSPRLLKVLDDLMTEIYRRNLGYNVSPIRNVEFLCECFDMGEKGIALGRDHWHYNIMQQNYHKYIS